MPRVRNVVTGFAEENAEIIVLMHSYGGIPGSAALKCLAKSDCTKIGKYDGVVRLVYIASFALREGESISRVGDLEPFRMYASDDDD